MKKKNNFFTCARYAAPVCNVVEMKGRRVICGSPVFGDTDKPGQAIGVEDEYEY